MGILSAIVNSLLADLGILIIAYWRNTVSYLGDTGSTILRDTPQGEFHLLFHIGEIPSLNWEILAGILFVREIVSLQN